MCLINLYNNKLHLLALGQHISFFVYKNIYEFLTNTGLEHICISFYLCLNLILVKIGKENKQK